MGDENHPSWAMLPAGGFYEEEEEPAPPTEPELPVLHMQPFVGPSNFVGWWELLVWVEKRGGVCPGRA